MRPLFCLALLALFTLSSCSTKILVVHYQVAPPSAFPPDVQHIGIGNGNNAFSSGSMTTPMTKEMEQDQLISFGITAPAVKSTLLNSANLHKGVTVCSGTLDLKRSQIGPREIKELYNYCTNNSIQGLVWLSQFHWNSEIKNTTDTTRKGQRVVVSNQHAEAEVLVRAYGCANGNLLAQEVMTNSYDRVVRGASKRETDQQLASQDQVQRELFDGLGAEIAYLFVPKPYTENRRVFVKGKKFLEGYRMMLDREWDKAFAHFLHLYYEADKKEKRRACYNLAVVQEKLGNLPAAISWLEEYQKIGGGVQDAIHINDTPEEYLRNLKSKI